MGKTILTVDDSASIRQMVAFTLETAGYQVVTAVDGKDALAKLGSATPDMIITDLNMPNMDGLQLITEVRKLGSHKFSPIVFLTTESDETKKTQAKAAGASGWIVKPFQQEQLLAVVKKFLG